MENEAKVREAFDWFWSLPNEKQDAVSKVVSGLMKASGMEAAEALIATYEFLKDKVK